MDLLDLIILALIVVLAFSGYRRGLTWGGLAMLGLVVGSVVGALVARPLTRLLSPTPGSANQSLIAVGIFLAVLLIIEGLGSMLGYRARALTLRTRLATWDSVAGSLTSAFGVLFVFWFIGFTFASSTLQVVNQQISGSAIERALLHIAPEPPAFLAQVEEFLQSNALPNPFPGLSPDLPDQIPPSNIDTSGVRAASAEVSQVVAYGCDGPDGAVAGSAWPVGPNLVLTNAHVVAGSQTQQVRTPDGRAIDATVVLFDPDVDVAILRVPGLGLSPLAIAGGNPAVGTQGAVIGYPEGGPEAEAPAAVRGTINATTWNIYYDSYVTRSTVVLSADVIPGDSGGPVVNLNGQVIGVTFAMSTTVADEGYALATSEVTAAIQAAQGRTGAVGDGTCVSE
ncbi:MAG TPA: MarP family serine protease [Candidatus Binatia bacterium]|nr:MarP family serine protease [Candidatus Binatia bacterium]